MQLVGKTLEFKTPDVFSQGLDVVKSPQTTEACSRCDGTGWVYRAEAHGGKGGVSECECHRLARLNKRAEEIPEYYTRYGAPRLSEIVPQVDADVQNKSKGYSSGQAKALEMFRSRPDQSWILMGPNGSGKSFFGWALWWEAVLSGRPAVATRLQEFIDSYRAWEQVPQWEKDADRPASRPALLPFDLKTQTKRTLFLDEVDKLSNVTRYMSQLFFDLVSNIRDYGHQLIVCTNLDWQGLEAMWSQQGDVYGNSIMRRLADIFQRGIVKLT